MLGFMTWLARVQPGADVSLAVVSSTDAQPVWVFHAEGLPTHIGVVHVEAGSPDECGKQARLLMAQKIAKRAQENAKIRERRCSYWSKKRFLTQREASDALLTITRFAPPGDRIPTELYECKREEGGCGGWHLTSHPRGRTPITEPLAPESDTLAP